MSSSDEKKIIVQDKKENTAIKTETKKSSLTSASRIFLLERFAEYLSNTCWEDEDE